MLLPLRATAKLVVAAAPVPSFTITKSPADGPAGNVIVTLPAVATTNVPAVTDKFTPVSVGSGWPVGALDAQAEPVLVNTLPEVLGATLLNAEVPLPITTELAVIVVAPVPPFATGKVPVTAAASPRWLTYRPVLNYQKR